MKENEFHRLTEENTAGAKSEGLSGEIKGGLLAELSR